MKIPRFKDFHLPVWFNISAIAVILYSIFVRIQGLGYSGFQGDEVNTVDFLYQMNNGIWSYLMDQKRGPIQYLLNIGNVSMFGYHNEFLIRLPYLIFGILALWTLFILARRMFNTTTALLTVLFMSVNGLFIAFARITQYQSLMYFTIPIAVLVFISAFNRDRVNYKKLSLSGLLVSLSLLIHYDTMSVMPFFMVGIVAAFYRGYASESKKRFLEFVKVCLVFFLIAMGPALAFYIPFFQSQAANNTTTSGYLQGRLFGGAFKWELDTFINLFMPGTNIAIKLLTMYIPKFFLYSFLVLGVVGIFSFYEDVRALRIFKSKISRKVSQGLYIFFTVMVLAGSFISMYDFKPRASSLTVILSSMAIVLILILSPKIKWYKAALVTWFLGAYSFYFFVMRDARTHVYVSMIPLFMLAGLGVYFVYHLFKEKVIKQLVLLIVILGLVAVSGVNYMVFVDKSPEYPWWDKDFLGFPIYRIGHVRHEKIEGVFGFNNYRGWDQVADLYKNKCLVGSFNSNEKNSITYFYTRFDQKKGNEWGVATDADNMIIVEGPHSWEYYNPKKLPENFALLKVIYSQGVPVSYIYGDKTVYPNLRLLCD